MTTLITLSTQIKVERFRDLRDQGDLGIEWIDRITGSKWDLKGLRGIYRDLMGI